jgi:hypothetical protein
MLDPRNPVVWIVGAFACVSVFFLLRGRFSAETRERRRRDKSHRPVISRKPGPTVKLAVRVDKPENGRKQ